MVHVLPVSEPGNLSKYPLHAQNYCFTSLNATIRLFFCDVDPLLMERAYKSLNAHSLEASFNNLILRPMDNDMYDHPTQ